VYETLALKNTPTNHPKPFLLLKETTEKIERKPE
jgi:hypothetical protein